MIFNIGSIVRYNLGQTAVAYPEFQRGGCLRSAPYEKWGGGGWGSPLQVRYTKRGGGGGAIRFRSDTKSGGWGGGGGPVCFRSDTFVWHTENTLSLIIDGYNFDRGGCSSTRSTPPWIRH